MIKHKGNIASAIISIKNVPNAASHIFEDAQYGEGLLNGAVVTIKNNLATKGVETNASSMFLDNFNPAYDATVVRKIKESGAAIVAKTHLDEFGMGGTGTFSAYGDILNPQDNSRLIGGSSSGSAATMNEYVTMAFASDTGDSVRKPAAIAGVVGFKPTYGAISRHGLFAYASSLDTVGVMTHNVSDAITASQVSFGKDPMDMTSTEVEIPEHKSVKPKTVAFLNMRNTLPDDVQIKYDALISKLKSKGIKVQKVDLPSELLRVIPSVYSIISYVESSSNLSNLNGLIYGLSGEGNNFEELSRNTRSKNLGPNVKKRITLGSYFSYRENNEIIFNKAKKIRRLIVNELNKIYNKFDLLIYPSNRIAPNKNLGFYSDWVEDIMQIANFAGSPSISIPWIKKDSFPIGITIEKGPKEDKQLLSGALYIEEMLGGKYD